MDKKEIEQKIVELKKQQGDYFKKKKADRDASALESVRKELNELKEQARGLYRAK